MAVCHMEGFGVPRDEKAALALCQQAAENNHPLACDQMARIYKSGWPAVGIQRNPSEAIQWLEKFLFAQPSCHLYEGSSFSFLERVSCHLTGQVNDLTRALEIQRSFEGLPDDLRPPKASLANYHRKNNRRQASNAGFSVEKSSNPLEQRGLT